MDEELARSILLDKLRGGSCSRPPFEDERCEIRVVGVRGRTRDEIIAEVELRTPLGRLLMAAELEHQRVCPCRTAVPALAFAA